MLQPALFAFVLVCTVTAEFPIVELKPECPAVISGSPDILLTTDVPAYGLAQCANGEKPFLSVNKAVHALKGTFKQKYNGDHCIFHFSKANSSFTVTVELGWGETDQSDSRSRIHVISCSYDQHGKSTGSTQTISDWHETPRKHQQLLGESHVSANIQLKVLDDHDKDVTWSTIPVGSKIKLLAYDTPDRDIGFRPLSCIAQNLETRYAILTEGCGDGLVLDNTVGFQTKGGKVYSPYFDAFRLRGEDSVHFVCNFSICSSNCDGDSCLIQTRLRREVPNHKEDSPRPTDNSVVAIKSNPIRTKTVEVKAEEPQKQPSGNSLTIDASDYLQHLRSLTRDYPAHPDPVVWLQYESDRYRERMYITMTIFGGALFLTLVLTIYLCCKYEFVGTDSCCI